MNHDTNFQEVSHKSNVQCAASKVFVFDGEFVAGIGPYCNGVDLRALPVDLANWHVAHPDQRTSRTARMWDLAYSFGEWTTMD